MVAKPNVHLNFELLKSLIGYVLIADLEQTTEDLVKVLITFIDPGNGFHESVAKKLLSIRLARRLNQVLMLKHPRVENSLGLQKPSNAH